MANCLPTHLAERMKRAIQNGTISIQTLSEMDSQGRRETFLDLFGKGGEENAQRINALFESKLL